ncbi:MAG: hypothetical protein ACXWLM_05200, partial [Myxococcales bacterium]
FTSVDEAYNALAAKQVKAVVYDAPVLQYHAAQGGQDRVVGHRFERQNYGIAIQEGSPLRKTINEVLLRLTEGGYIAELRQKYFGDGD